MKVNLDTGAESVAAGFANRLQAFKQTSLNKMAEQSAQRGQQEALADAQGSEEPIWRSDFTASGQAYNKAMATTYKTRVSTDLKETLSVLATEYKDDVATFNDLADEAVKSIVTKADPRLQNELALDADVLLSSYRTQVHKNTIDKNFNVAKVEFANDLQVRQAEALRLAENARTPEEYEQASEYVAGTIGSMADAVKGGLIDEGQMGQELLTMQKGFAEQTFMNQVDDALAISPEAAYKKITELEPTPSGWSPLEWDAFLNKARLKVNQANSKNEAAAAANLKMLRRDIGTLEKKVANGFTGGQEATNLYNQAVASGDPILIERASNSVKVGAFSVLSEAQRDAMLSQAMPSTMADQRLYDEMEAANESAKKHYDNDPIGYLAKQGLFDQEPFPIDPNQFAEYMQNATMNAEMATVHGGSQAPLFDKLTLESWKSQLPTMDTAGKMQIMGLIESSTSEAAKLETYERLLGQERAFAWVGSTQNADLARRVFENQDLAAAGQIKIPKGNKDIRRAVQARIGDLPIGGGLVETVEILLAPSFDEGGIVDQTEVDNLISQLVGGIEEYNGSNIILPKIDGITVDSDDFDTFIDNFNEEGYAASGGAVGYSLSGIKEILPDATLVSVGANQYQVIDNTYPDTPRKLMSENGQPFVMIYDPAYGYQQGFRGRQRADRQK